MSSPPLKSDLFQRRLRDTVARLNRKLTPDQLNRLSTAMPRVAWDFPDAQTRLCLGADPAPSGLRIVDDCGDSPVRVQMDRTVFESAALGTGSLGSAFLAGKIRVQGLNPLRLWDFISLVDPLLSSFREACDEC